MEKRLPIRLSFVSGLTGLAWASLYEIQLAVFNQFAPDAVALNKAGQTPAQWAHGIDQINIFGNVVSASGWLLAAAAVFLSWWKLTNGRFLSALAVGFGMTLGGFDIWAHVFGFWGHSIAPGQLASAVLYQLPVALFDCGVRTLVIYLIALAVVWPIDRMKLARAIAKTEPPLPENLRSSERRKIEAARLLVLYVVADDMQQPEQLDLLIRNLGHKARFNTSQATRNYIDDVFQMLPELVISQFHKRRFALTISIERFLCRLRRLGK